MNLAALEIDQMSVAVRTIIELNIKHFQNLLRSATDAAKRQVIAKLLAEEEAKLARLAHENRGGGGRG